MRGLYRVVVLMSLMVAVLLSVACRKDIYSISGVDVDAYISMTLSGSRFNFYNESLTSKAGYFTSYNHPEVVVKDGGGFEFSLYREMGSIDDVITTLYFNIDRDDLPFMLDNTYALYYDGESQAQIDFLEYGEKTPIDSGGYIREGKVYSYEAVDGYIIFTSMKEYGDDYLLGGEFCFKGRNESGDEVTIEGGKFNDCRVCLSYGESCH